MKTKLIALVAAIAAAATTAMFTRSPARAGGPDRERGRYLVERVGLCQDCHSGRDRTGAFVPEQWFAGAPLPFVPTVEMPWAPTAKPIAGLPGLDDAEALTFLTTGVLPGGRMPLPPMPSYRFSTEDARDVIAYLRDPIRPAAGVPLK